MRIIATVIALLLITGCSPQYRLGETVVVDLDQNIRTGVLQSRRDGPRAMRPYVEAALGEWNDIGARFTLEPVPGVRHLRIAGADERDGHGDAWGWADFMSATVYVYLPLFAGDMSELGYRDLDVEPYEGAVFQDVVAHEVGHMMGLGHLDEADAVMNAQAGPHTALSAADIHAIDAINN